MKHYKVQLSPDAQDDLERLYDFLLGIDETVALRAMDAIESSYRHLERAPFSCRKAADGELGSRWRELLINFGASGYVALFEIENDTTVTITALRHQRESDYH